MKKKAQKNQQKSKKKTNNASATSPKSTSTSVTSTGAFVNAESSPKKSPILNAANKAYAAITFLVTIAGLFFFWPNVELTPQGMSNPLRPLNTIVKLKNTSNFSIYDVKIRFVVDSVNLNNVVKLTDGNFAGRPDETIPEIERGRSYDHYEEMTFLRYESAGTVTGYVRYNVDYTYLFFRKHDTFRYRIISEEPGKLQWLDH